MWINLAVESRANLMYVGVLAVGVTAAMVARLRPDGMARTMLATALAQVLVAVVVLMAGLGSAAIRWRVLALNGFFVALFGRLGGRSRKDDGRCCRLR